MSICWAYHAFLKHCDRCIWLRGKRFFIWLKLELSQLDLVNFFKEGVICGQLGKSLHQWQNEIWGWVFSAHHHTEASVPLEGFYFMELVLDLLQVLLRQLSIFVEELLYLVVINLPA